jgi:antitoxin (DNA-binding transcriptional repressor) of toxin-antitoxin stability system
MGRTSAQLGDTAPYAIEREIEDIGALIAKAGGVASMYSHASGAGLALHAAAHGRPVAKLVLHEPPYVADSEEEQRTSQEFGEKLKTLLAEDRRGDAVELALTTGMVGRMRNEPWWAGMEAMAPTIAYDFEVMGDISMGSTIPTDLLGAVTVPALVLCGRPSPRRSRSPLRPMSRGSGQSWLDRGRHDGGRGRPQAGAGLPDLQTTNDGRAGARGTGDDALMRLWSSC